MRLFLIAVLASLLAACTSFKADQFGGCFFTGAGECRYQSGAAAAPRAAAAASAPASAASAGN